LCIYSELNRGEEHFYIFDLWGKGNEIAGTTIRDTDFYSFNWSLSPDASCWRFPRSSEFQGQPAIRLFSLADAKERRISLPGWVGITTLDWSADGESLWATAFTTSERTSGLWTNGFNATGEWTLLKVGSSDKITPMLRESRMNLGWAIPFCRWQQARDLESGWQFERLVGPEPLKRRGENLSLNQRSLSSVIRIILRGKRATPGQKCFCCTEIGAIKIAAKFPYGLLQAAEDRCTGTARVNPGDHIACPNQ
jgi:hypothetical protein